jgi:transposase InsO family protein
MKARLREERGRNLISGGRHDDDVLGQREKEAMIEGESSNHLFAARAPNQVWSWDITKLLGPAKWDYFHLYVILDVYSRSVVGWMVTDRESAALAERLIVASCQRQGIARGQLTLHADLSRDALWRRRLQIEQPSAPLFRNDARRNAGH